MSENSERQALHVGLALIGGVAVLGFFMGVSSPPEGAPAFHQEAVGEIEGAEPALSYREQRSRPPSSGSDWNANLALLGAGEESPATKAETLAARQARRAYDGAPPTIPHAVRQQEANECLACHEDGLRARDRLATPIPHAEYVCCTQCRGPVSRRTPPSPPTDSRASSRRSKVPEPASWLHLRFRTTRRCGRSACPVTVRWGRTHCRAPTRIASPVSSATRPAPGPICGRAWRCRRGRVPEPAGLVDRALSLVAERG